MVNYFFVGKLFKTATHPIVVAASCNDLAKNSVSAISDVFKDYISDFTSLYSKEEDYILLLHCPSG